MNFTAPLSPPWLVAIAVVIAYALLVAVWRWPSFVVRHPWWVLAMLGAVSLASALCLVDLRTGAVRVRLDASEEPLMLRGDPARDVYKLATQTFGNDDVFVIAMVTDDVFSADNLESLRRISHQVL